MKKIFTIIAFLALLVPATNVQSQVLSESAKRKFTVGVDVFTDIWMVDKVSPYTAPTYSNRTINQGATVFFMYNKEFKPESLNSISIGLAIRNQNSYSNSYIEDLKADTIKLKLVSNDYKISKINLTYIDLPVEVKFRTKGGFKVGVGLKVGYLMNSKEKYVGNRPEDKVNVKVKSQGINQLEDWTYGATLRIGYKWISAFGYYQFNDVFVSGRGPVMKPISVGITITPF